jgi:hypothetical protein
VEAANRLAIDEIDEIDRRRRAGPRIWIRHPSLPLYSPRL